MLFHNNSLDGQIVSGISDGNSIFFYNGVFSNKGITSLQLPKTIEFIGNNAFFGNLLTDVNFSTCTSLTRIGDYAFAANAYTDVDLSGCSKLKIIGNNAFYYNENLPFIVLPIITANQFNGWKDGNNNSFLGGDKVTDFETYYYADMPYTLTDNDVVVDENGIIQSCSYDFFLKKIIIPEVLDEQSVKGIVDRQSSNGVFYKKGITSLKLPATIESIGTYAFYSNPLIELDLSACSKLSIIKGFAFNYNALTSLDLRSCYEIT